MQDAQPQPGNRIDTGQLWKWVDQLTRDRRQRLVRQIPGTKPRVEHVDIPSLWTQLTEAAASSNTGGGRGKSSTGSRSPIDLVIEDLLIEISAYVVDALSSHDHRPRVLISARTRDRYRHDTKSDLRQLAAVVVGTLDLDLITWWTDRYRSWVARAQTALTAEDENIDTRGVRGHACPVCQALWVTAERDREKFREPALVISFRDGQVLHITCRACGTGWWRGDDVDELTRQIAINTAVRGEAHLWGKTTPRRASN